MKTNEPEIIGKLDQFIRKYYKNRLLRGVIWSCTLTALVFLLFILPENFFYFSTAVRTALFFSYLAILLFVVIRLILIPAFQLMKIGKVISYEQAAKIVGQHFSEIQDKLLNTLELIGQANSQAENRELLLAGIEQKTRMLTIFRFTRAVDMKRNLRYLRYTIIPVGILAGLIIFSPRTISEPARRIVHFDQTFEKPSPFRIELLNKKLIALQQEDFEVQVRLTGEEIPEAVFFKTGAETYKMSEAKGFVYKYRLKSLQGDIRFRIAAGKLETKEYTLNVLPKPIILNFDMIINYPEYTGKKDEVIDNQGDIVIPEGTSIRWNFYTKDVSEILLRFNPEMILVREKSGNRFSFTATPLRNCNYTIRPENGSVRLADSLLYRIMVINDGYPSIFITEQADSILPTNLFFKGAIKDDYGFTRLTFNYGIKTTDDTSAVKFTQTEIPIGYTTNNQVFYHTIDLVNLLPDPGKEIVYYFEVSDNDRIHGSKSTRSELRSISTPTLAELSEKTDQNAEYINDELEKSLSEAKSVKKTLDDLNKKMVDQNNMTWQEKKKLEDMIRQTEAIQKRVEEIRKKTEENINNEEKYLETSERIIEKQKKLNEMMDQLFSEELKKMIEELKSLMNQIDKTKLGNMLEKMKMSNKELENQLDRNLELMKQIEFDRKVEQTVSELRKNADSLEKLAEKTEQTSANNDELLEKQEEISKKSEELLKNIDELKEESRKLEDPVDLGETKKTQDTISSNLSESKANLEKKENKKAGKNQKKAAGGMKELAQQLESANMEAENEQMEEDAENIRQILENLVRLSFDQEELLNQTKAVAKTDPRYLELIVRQKDFQGKMKIIEDSLNAIAKRQIEIKPVISKEIASINQNLEMALDAFEARNIGTVTVRQQYAMTSINNLALLLNESLEKMNQEMSSSMQSKSGSKSCNNPKSKGGKKSAKNMKEMQGKIGEQLKKLKDGLEKQKQNGTPGRQEQQAMNKELAKLAAQQEALRNEMQKYQEQLSEQGVKDQSGLKDAARDMEQIEKDLVNKRITQETINRQQRILSRLLESEKAEQTREREERRESEEAKNPKVSNLGTNYEYKKEKRGGEDQLQYMLPSLRSFYRSKVNSYIVKIEQ